MSSSLQSFEGDTLEAALARVAEECGPGARITQAEKVRSGGIGGFFTHERYEVTVEIDGSVSGAAASPRETAGERPAEPMSLLDLVEQVSQQERAAVTTAPPIAAPSTEGIAFREVLRDIASQSGLLDDHSVDEILGTSRVDDVPTESLDTDEDRRAMVVEAEEGSMEPTVAVVVDPPAVAPPAAEAAVVALSAGVDAPAPTVDGRAMFRSLGIPGPMVERRPGLASIAQQLLAVLEQIEPAPPVLARRGDVVAVVGVGRETVVVAAVLAEQLGQTADDIVIASPDEHRVQTLRDPAATRERIGMWRRCGVPFVVAVCAPDGPEGATWARQMLEALDAVTVWASVAADRKPEDIAAWAESVGGVDALAVTACDRTASPAAVLGTGIPVAVLEGRRASPAAWTAMLVERLTL